MATTTETPKKQKTRSIEHAAASLAQLLSKYDIRIVKIQGDLTTAKAEREKAAKEADPKVLALAEAIRAASTPSAVGGGKGG